MTLLPSPSVPYPLVVVSNSFRFFDHLLQNVMMFLILRRLFSVRVNTLPTGLNSCIIHELFMKIKTLS